MFIYFTRLNTFVTCMKARFVLVSLCFFSLVNYGLGQGVFKRKFDAKPAFIFDVTAKYQIPGADLSKRFGKNATIGLDLTFKAKNNWFLTAGGHFMFGKNVKELGLLDTLKGETGEIIDQNGQFAVIGYNERGMYLGGSLGKIIPLNKVNGNSGLVVSVGGGYLQHRIKIFSTSTVPQLAGNYKKGYDRMTTGPALTQFIGYRFMDPVLRLNFVVGFEMIEGFTQNRRNLNFDTGFADHTKRLDLLYGLRFSLSVPLYLKKADEEEFFN